MFLILIIIGPFNFDPSKIFAFGHSFLVFKFLVPLIKILVLISTFEYAFVLTNIRNFVFGYDKYFLNFLLIFVNIIT